MTKHGTGTGIQASRRDVLRTATGMVAAGLVGGALLHTQAEPAQAVERDLAENGVQGNVFTVEIEGGSQGKFLGIQGLGFHYQVGMDSYQNGNTGEVFGAPRHGSVVVTKQWDGATPQIFQALVTGEHLKQVIIEFYNSGGGVYQRIMLSDARVVNLEQYMHFNAAGHTIGDDPRQLEDVAFGFNEIAIENLDGGTFASDGLK